MAEYRAGARRWRRQSDKKPEEGCLASAVGPDNCQNLALIQSEAHIIEGYNRFLDRGSDEKPHPPLGGEIGFGEAVNSDNGSIGWSHVFSSRFLRAAG
jgi:hypothetical protein